MPFFIYGTVKSSGVVLSGITVSVSTATATTNSSGKYQLNIQDVATDGGSVTVIASGRGDISSSTFTLSLATMTTKQINFELYYNTKVTVKSGKRLYVLTEGTPTYILSK